MNGKVISFSFFSYQFFSSLVIFREFCSLLVSKIRCTQEETDESVEVIPFEEENSWVDNLAQLVIKVPPAPPQKDDSVDHMGTENYRLAHHTNVKYCY